MRWRIREAGGTVEATSRPQAHEDLAVAPLESLLQLHGIVARVEDEQGDDPFFQPTHQSLDLLCGDHVGVLGGSETPHVHGGAPTLAHEVELCDELVGPEQATMGCPAEWRDGW